MDVEFVRDVHSAKEQGEFREALRMIAQTPHGPYSYTDMLADWANFQTSLAIGDKGLNDEEAFSKQGERMPPFEWARTFMYRWPALQWVAMRVTSLTCSASGCEHSWSIEGWIHSSKRNRLGHRNVERLVRAHTNLLLDNSLNDFVAAILPWEIEMIIEEPEHAELASKSPLPSATAMIACD